MMIETEYHCSNGQHAYPPYDALDFLRNYLIIGDPSLGFVHTYRPDIYIVPDQTHNEFDPAVIIPKIDLGLAQGKKVALMWWDADLLMPNKHSENLNRALASYRDEPVYLCVDMYGTGLLQYTSPTHRNIPVKVLHCPWTQLTVVSQLCLATKQPFHGPCQQSPVQFCCFTNRLESHKEHLVRALLARNLDAVGHLVVKGQKISKSHYPVVPFYKWRDRTGWISSHDMQRCLIFDQQLEAMVGHWYLTQQRLNLMMSDIPLVVHADTSMGYMPISDKVWWPLMSGRMMLLYGRSGIYQEIREITGFDSGCYLDLEFDSIEGWDQKARTDRLECMLDKNLYVIKHAREKWHEVGSQLQDLALKIPNTLYQNFCRSLDQIK